MDICTIIAKNYVPFARVLARSLERQRPGARCFTLVIDDPRGYIDPGGEPFELVEIESLGIDRFDHMAAMYDVLELSTAVKPWLLRHLMSERGAERVLYLDPDIRLFDPLDEVDALLREQALVVTPHLAEEMPRDGAKPSERDILESGAYNLGFLGIADRPESHRLLDWWSERLETDCIVAPTEALFVDQRWMDLAPGLVEGFRVLRDPGYNVAYWNLGGRRVRRDGDGFEVNDTPLRFFHFSGFDPRTPGRMSKHQDRIRLEEEPALRELCGSYAAELLSEGFEEAVGWPYSWAELPGGLPLDKALRRTCRDAVRAGAITAPLFTGEGVPALLEWANGPAVEGGEAGATRYLVAYHATRDDLKEEMPDPTGIDGPRLLAWAEVFGRGQIAPQLMPAAGPRTVLPGVNLAGYFEAVLGVGEAARQVVDALMTQGVQVAPVALVAGHSPRGPGLGVRERHDAPHAINLMCVNPDQVPHLARDLGHGFFLGRYTIGMWWWEVNRLPEDWQEAFEHVDEVWVGTRHVADAISPVSPVPVVQVRLPVSVPDFEPLSREDLGLPEKFLYMLVFDYHSVFERKNPLALVEAFGRAFGPGEGAALVLKCMNHEHYPDRHARLLEAAAGHPEVHVIDRHVPRAEKDAMIAACDCYVSLHRSEGFGITLAEAMALGKPVVATGYSGNLDFMTPENSWLVEHRLVKVGEGSPPYPADADWAEPDVDHAARLMREVFEDPAAAGERSARGRAELLASHSPQAAGKTMARRLMRVRSFAGARGLRGPLRIADTTKAAELVRSGPTQPAPPSRLAGARSAARTGLLRLLKPFAVHQQRVDNELLRAIHALDTTVRSLASTQADFERALADLRAAPFEPSAPFELIEHPVAGVVEGFRAEPQSAAVSRAPDEEVPVRTGFEELLGGREPVLELDAAASEPAAVLEPEPAGSHGAVWLRDVVGQLDDAGLRRLLQAALRVLAPAGALLLEATNPHSLVAAKRLAADPRRPRAVYPEQLLDLCRETGFREAFAFYPGGLGNVEADRHREDRYAVFALTPGVAPMPDVGARGGSVPARD